MWKAAVGNKTDAKAKMVNDEVCTLIDKNFYLTRLFQIQHGQRQKE